MGYTHYWYRKNKSIPADLWAKIVVDCERVARVSELPLAGAAGDGVPEFTDERIWFNGLTNCGHEKRNLGITWPAPKASGIGNKVSGEMWFAGAMLSARTCGGDCSHETFGVSRILGKDAHVTADGFFDCCKTAYKPYDIVVTACLIVLKYYLGDSIRVSTDGEANDWADGIQLCKCAVGYGELPFDAEVTDEG